MQPTVLVTGGAGFIGSHIVDELVAYGCDVRSLDNLHRAAHVSKPGYLNPAAEYRWGDVADAATTQDAIDGVDVVCHQAAMVGLGVDFADAPAYVHDNDSGTAVLLAALADARFTGRLVLASSMAVYGEGRYRCCAHGDVAPEPRAVADLEAGRFEPCCPRCGDDLEAVPVRETDPVDPRSVYAATKLHQEHLCHAFGRERHVAVTSLRYHNVYGARMPRDTPYAGVASLFRSSLAQARAPQVFEDGGQLRDFIHVRDVGHANVVAITAAEPKPGIFNVASGRPRSVLEMARALAGAFDAPISPEVTGQYRLGDVRHVFASSEHAIRGLGFRAQIGFEAGMHEFATVPLRA